MSHRQPQLRLDWRHPGTVWAIDFVDAPPFDKVVMGIFASWTPQMVLAAGVIARTIGPAARRSSRGIPVRGGPEWYHGHRLSTRRM